MPLRDWILFSIPVLFVAILIYLSPGTGIVAAIVLVGVVAAYLASGARLSRARWPCPACREKKLKSIDFFLTNPPPSFEFFRCEGCGAEYVRFDGAPDFVERSQSGLADSPGWDVVVDRKR